MSSTVINGTRNSCGSEERGGRVPSRRKGTELLDSEMERQGRGAMSPASCTPTGRTGQLRRCSTQEALPGPVRTKPRRTFREVDAQDPATPRRGPSLSFPSPRSCFARDPRSRGTGGAATEYFWAGLRQSAKQLSTPFPLNHDGLSGRRATTKSPVPRSLSRSTSTALSTRPSGSAAT